MTSRRPLLPLLLAAGATLAALLWAVVLLQADGPGLGQPSSAPPPRSPTAAPSRPVEIDPVERRPEAANGSETPPEPLPLTPELVAVGPEAVFGRVLDAGTGKPVASFQVTLLEHRATEEPLERLEEVPPRPFHRREGIFRIDTEPGLYDVVIKAPGFKPAAVQGVAVPAVDLVPRDYRLDRGAGIAGRVFDEHNMAVAGVKLFLAVRQIKNPTDPPPRILVATSGVDGTFSFTPLPPGEYAVTALRPDNELDQVAGIRVYDGTTNVDIHLTPRHVVTLKLRDELGRPVQRARITLRGDDHYATAHSNRSGLAILHHVPDGSYQIRATAKGYDDMTEHLELVGGMSDEVRFYTMLRQLDG